MSEFVCGYQVRLNVCEYVSVFEFCMFVFVCACEYVCQSVCRYIDSHPVH